MATATCMCSGTYCDHKPGELCGKPVAVTVMNRVNGGKEREIGICEECWCRIKKELAWPFP